MKKLVTLFSCVFALMSISFAQNVSLKITGASATPYLVTNLAGEFVVEHVHVVNKTTSMVNVMAKRVADNILPGQGDFFCWDNCYDSTVNESNSALPIMPLDSATSFSLHFKPNGISGQSSVTMRFYVETKPSDFVEQTFYFDAVATAIDENLLNATLSAPAPNPATFATNVAYKLPNGVSEATLKVMNSLGQEVKNMHINEVAGNLSVSTSELSNGIYTLLLMNEGNIIGRRRLVVNN
jgi:hypothetical protein